MIERLLTVMINLKSNQKVIQMVDVKMLVSLFCMYISVIVLCGIAGKLDRKLFRCELKCRFSYFYLFLCVERHTGECMFKPLRLGSACNSTQFDQGIYSLLNP